MGDTYKRGAVAIAVEKACMKREYFTSDVLKFGIEEENKAVFKLLAAFVLLCVESHETVAKEPLNLAQPNTTCLIREVKADKSFAFRKCTLPQGINFKTQPYSYDSTFYAVRQLDYGRSGACCYAFTSTFAPCVLKFFRSQKDIENDRIFVAAKAEAEMWQKLYGEYGIDFVKAYEQPLIFLVMPYLIIPHTFGNERSF
jgi:hypothetical protein